MEEKNVFKCLNCSMVSCEVCGPLPRKAFEESMLQHRSSKDQRTLCQDCTHPECTAEGCTTCKSCRAEDCSAKKHDAPCKNLLKPLHPLRFPSNLEEKRSFRCDACRYKCASSQCRRTMPRKRRKVSELPWTCGDCLTVAASQQSFKAHGTNVKR
jgi:hypothetical protein